jgi:type I restriction enzyme S subunit
MYYLISSEIGKTNINLSVKGAAQPGLNIGHIKNYIFTFPPKEEQLEIKNRLKITDTRINNLISKLNSVIDRLKEYRQSLISEAVTGKIDVRDWQPNKEQIA